MIVTFYSYKGGVGRSMAVANVAELLRRRGLDVLMVDFDLEAPGLERYFDTPETEVSPGEMQKRRGVLDLLHSYVELRVLKAKLERAVEDPATARETASETPFPVEPLDNFLAPVYTRSGSRGSLTMLPAGQRSVSGFSAYAERLRAFDWNELYAHWDGERFFEWLRLQLLDRADVVLIDSRTGVTEMGGVCAYHLADAVALLVASNRQNLDGTAMMVRSLRHPDLIEKGRAGRELSLLCVPSRVDDSEFDPLQDFARRYYDELALYMPKHLDLEGNAFHFLKIPYVPYYAYMESVAVRDEEEGAKGLAEAFENLASTLALLAPRDHPFRQAYHVPKAVLVYRQGSEPDEHLTLRILQELGEHFGVFIDQSLPAGVAWEQEIGRRFEAADFFIVLLSAESLASEAVRRELELAHRLSREGSRNPRILPVRLAYREPFTGVFAEWLNPLQWAFWEGPKDTPRLIADLRKAMTGADLPIASEAAKQELLESRPTLESPGGPMAPESPFYVERRSDSRAAAALHGSSTVVLKGPRKVGKSSLLLRLASAAQRRGRRVILLDFQALDLSQYSELDVFLRDLCSWLSRELALEDRVAETWRQPLDSRRLCTDYIERWVLGADESPLLLALDQVERIFDCSFSLDFFTMLRNWHNLRARRQVWKRLELLLVSSIEPNLFIDNVYQSPFSVGDEITLNDFEPPEVAELNRRHGSPLTPEEESRLVDLLGGHPYLTHLALYQVADRRMSAEELFARAGDYQGPFSSQLRRLSVLLADEQLADGLRRVIAGESVSETMFFRLEGAGLASRAGSHVRPRCQLYADFFLRSEAR